MTGKSTESRRHRAIQWDRAVRLQRSSMLQLLGRLVLGCLLVGELELDILQAKPKTEKFEGTVVVVGPKAITVKSRNNIYLVRTFHYSPELEQKILRKKPATGKKVTVHYIPGSDLALKVD